MSWWVAGAQVGSSIIGGRKAKKAARQQEARLREGIGYMEGQYGEALAGLEDVLGQQMGLYDPYAEAGMTGLGGLVDLSTPEGQARYYSQYYQSPQFAAQAQAATGTQLAAAEATGGLQATSTANQLARISPTLGMEAMAQQQQLYGGLTGIGQQAVGQQAGFLGTYGAGQADLRTRLARDVAEAYGLVGQSQAGAQTARGQTLGDILNIFGGVMAGR